MFEEEGAIVSFFFLKALRLYTSNNLLLAAESKPLCDDPLDKSVDLLFSSLTIASWDECCPGYYKSKSVMLYGDCSV